MMSVEITPLQPPFDQDIVRLHFKDKPEMLAVSLDDFKKIVDILGPDLASVTIELSPAGGEKIRIAPRVM